MRAPGYPVLFVGSFLVGAPAPALAVMHVECGVATTCVTDTTTGTRHCKSMQYCWPVVEFSPGPVWMTGPISGKPGVKIPVRPTDVNADGAMDCWKNVTSNASISSGFPYRNDGSTPHQGVDIVSGTANYGRGAPVFSLGAGYVVQAGYSDANGNYVRVAQGDGNTVTYIHLLNRSVGTNTEVGVGTKIGEMNCTGYCGGGPESPNHGKISSTHVHIQVKRTDDSTAYLDAVDLYGGESCAAADVPPGPLPPEEPCNPIPELRNNDQANRQVQHCLISGGSQ